MENKDKLNFDIENEFYINKYGDISIFDCHTHLFDEKIYPNLDEYINYAKLNKVKCMVNTSTCLEDFAICLDIKNKYPNLVYSCLGIHPEYAHLCKENSKYIESSFDFIKSKEDSIVGIGEIGLDYHYLDNLDSSEKELIKSLQKELFIKQINLARELNLPIVVHSRDASLDTFNIVKEHCSSMKVYMHCYSQSKELAREYLKLDCSFYFGIGGVLTFKNSKVLKEVVEIVPIQNLVTETDSPYLAPTPNRGKLNRSEYILYVLDEIARIKNISIQEANSIINSNCRRLFNVK